MIASPDKASVVKLINGIDAATYVTDLIMPVTYNQDPDAAYNSMFYQLASFAVEGGEGYFKASGRSRFIYPGPNTTFTFENKTVVTFENQATVKKNMTGVVDGASYYAKFCEVSDDDDEESSIASTAEPEQLVAVPGYPKPVIITEDASVSGYYLEGAGYEDVAVISLLDFMPSSTVDFQAVCQDFLAEAVAAGKTKLIVDLQQNGGGYILQGYDFFRQLFPSIEQDGFSRWRANDAFLAMSSIVSARVADVNPHTESDEVLVDASEWSFNWRYDLNLTNEPFRSFDDKFGPRRHRGADYTALMRWNLDNNLTTTNETHGMGIDITGYGALTADVVDQPFAADDIMLLYDGACASTCALVAEMLRIQAGVKSVAMGGRPSHKGRIQGVGGVKGAQVLDFDDIQDFARQYAGFAGATPEQVKELGRLGDLPIRRSTAAAVNVRDQILRDNVDDGVPAQFVVEESDCRLFWTADMHRDVSAVWRAVADAAWKGGRCAAGSVDAGNGGGGNHKEKKRKQAKKRLPPRERRSDVARRLRHGPDVHDPAWEAVHVLKAIP